MSKTLTPEQSQKLAKDLRLKPRTKAFADKLLSDPSISQTQAYLQTHNTNNPDTAKVEASRTLTKPNVKVYMDKHIDRAKMRIVELVESDKEDIALRASESILDRSLGKATVVQENTSYQQINITLGTQQVISEQ